MTYKQIVSPKLISATANTPLVGLDLISQSMSLCGSLTKSQSEKDEKKVSLLLDEDTYLGMQEIDLKIERLDVFGVGLLLKVISKAKSQNPDVRINWFSHEGDSINQEMGQDISALTENAVNLLIIPNYHLRRAA